MLQNESLVFFTYKLGFDTAENEPRQVRCKIEAREPWFGIVSVLADKLTAALALQAIDPMHPEHILSYSAFSRTVRIYLWTFAG